MTKYDGPKPKAQKNKKLMLVRYGRMGFMGWFSHNESHISAVNSHVVIKTRRGLELGELIGRFNYRGGQFKNTAEQVDEYFGGKGRDCPLAEGGTFVRFATEEDLMEQQHLEISAAEEAKCCDKFITEMNLPMKVVDSEHLFGGERIVIYFTSSGRVDFRELVRRLAREYQTRIELRQIGSRDEAKLVGDFESCGQECCCRRFLKILEPVNMRMAKLQKATLDPSKISGHCGRLKCCLRYEDETYRDLKKGLPRKNALVKTPKGEGKVAAVQILTQLVVVQDASGKRDAFNVDEIEVIGAPNGSPAGNGAPGADDVDDEEILDNNGSVAESPQQLVDIESEDLLRDDSVQSDSQRPQNDGRDRNNNNRSDNNQNGDNRNRNNRRRGRGRNRNRNNTSRPNDQGRTDGA